MTTTLITDGFADETPTDSQVYDFAESREYNIVYGEYGYTDALSREALDLLLQAGAIRNVETQRVDRLVVRVYRSVEGRTHE